MLSEQVVAVVLVHGPPNPAKAEPETGTAVSTTAVEAGNVALQVPGQTIAAGLLVTLPEPVPPSVTVNRWLTVAVKTGRMTKSSVTAARVAAQVLPPGPEIGPGHPIQFVKVAPAAGAATRVTVSVGGGR
jgi:hypothetical protein